MLQYLKNIADMSRSNAIPILAYVKLDGERAVGTDLDMLLEVPCSVDGLSAPLAVPLAPLLKLKDPSLSDEGDDKLTARQDGLTLKLDTLPAEDFPVLQADGFRANIDGDGLLDAFRRLAPCISISEMRYYLNGVYLDAHGGEFHAVATDNHKFGRIKIGTAVPDGMPDNHVIIPRKAIQTLLRIGSDIESVDIAQAYIRFHLDGGAILTTKLIVADYIDYRRVLTEPAGNHLALGRNELLKACKDVKKLNLGGRAVTLRLEAERVTLRQQSHDGAVETSMVADWQGQDGFEIAFDVNYLIELLSLLDGTKAFFEIRGHREPVSVGKTYVLMPALKEG